MTFLCSIHRQSKSDDMVFGKLTLERMFGIIDGSDCAYYDTIFPQESPEKCSFTVVDDDAWVNLSDTYRKELSDVVGFDLEMPISPVFLATENAFTRGNCLWALSPVSIKIFQGSSGHVMRICDSGAGFDYLEQIRNLQAGEPIAYRGCGKGLKAFHMSPLTFSYEGCGNIVNILLHSETVSISEREYKRWMEESKPEFEAWLREGSLKTPGPQPPDLRKYAVLK
jgi:hypothetical protein